MADNTTLQSATLATAPANLVIAGDDISSVFYQRLKVKLGPDGTATADWAGRAIGTDGVAYVDPRRSVVRLQDASSGTTTASTNYTAGDQIGAIQNITSAFRATQLTGTITNVVLIDEGDVCPTTAGYDIYFWYQSVTLASDNAAGPAVSDADSAFLVGKIEMPAFRDEGANRFAYWNGALDVSSADTSLYYSYVTRGDHNFFAATDDLNLTIYMVQD